MLTTVKTLNYSGTSLVVQWLRLCASNAGGMDSIPGWGTKIPHTTQCLAKTKILSYSFIKKYWATHSVPGLVQAIVDSRVHLIEMAPAIWGWSHSSQLSWEPGVILLSLFHPGGEWRSKSAHWCFGSADHGVTTLTSDSPNHCPEIPTVPLASVLIRCGYFFFLTLRLNFSSSAECLLSFMLFFLLQIPILFYWLSFADGPPISSFLCLWFYEHVCICSDVFVFPCQQILLVFFFC